MDNLIILYKMGESDSHLNWGGVSGDYKSLYFLILLFFYFDCLPPNFGSQYNSLILLNPIHI